MRDAPVAQRRGRDREQAREDERGGGRERRGGRTWTVVSRTKRPEEHQHRERAEDQENIRPVERMQPERRAGQRPAGHRIAVDRARDQEQIERGEERIERSWKDQELEEGREPEQARQGRRPPGGTLPVPAARGDRQQPDADSPEGDLDEARERQRPAADLEQCREHIDVQRRQEERRRRSPREAGGIRQPHVAMGHAIRQTGVKGIVLLDRHEQRMPPEIEEDGQLDHEDRQERDECGEGPRARLEWNRVHDASAAKTSAPRCRSSAARRRSSNASEHCPIRLTCNQLRSTRYSL